MQIIKISPQITQNHAPSPCYSMIINGVTGLPWSDIPPPVDSCGTLYMYMGCFLFELFGIHAYGVKIHLRNSSYLDHPHTCVCHVHTKNS